MELKIDTDDTLGIMYTPPPVKFVPPVLRIEATPNMIIHSSRQYRWNPQPDITVYELALCVPVLIAYGWGGIDQVALLPPEAQRHFVAIETE